MAADTSVMDTSQFSLEPSQEEKDELLEDLPVHVTGDTKEELGVSEAGMASEYDISVIGRDSDDVTTNPAFKTRRYINQGGNFVTGLDTTTKEAAEKRMSRATRFGTDPLATHSQSSLGISKLNSRAERFGTVAPVKNGEVLKFVKQLPSVPESGILRPNAILVYGTNEMSTDDIFKYFIEYGPSYLEWINDVSCNAVWEDPSTAQRALLGKGTNPVFEEKDRDRMQTEEVEPTWRMGEAHLLSKQLLLRYATDKDVKEKGAAQKSMYYRKYGNPNVEKKMARYRKIRESKKTKTWRENEEFESRDDLESDSDDGGAASGSQTDLREIIGHKRPLSSVAKLPSSEEDSEGEGPSRLQSMVVVPPRPKTLRCDAVSEEEEEKMEVEISGKPHVKGDDLRERLTRRINIMKRKMTNVKSRLGTKSETQTT